MSRDRDASEKLAVGITVVTRVTAIITDPMARRRLDNAVAAARRAVAEAASPRRGEDD